MKHRLFFALILGASVALSPVLALAEPAETPQVTSESVTPSTASSEEGGVDDVAYTAYTKKKTYLYKAKKAATKGAVRVNKHEPVGVIEKGKSWTKAVYGGATGYFKNADLIAELPTPTSAPTPTPVPKNPLIALPASVGETVYAGQGADISITPAQMITAFVLDYYSLGEGYYSRINSAVSSNIEDILKGTVPSALSDYAACVSAVASDISGGLTLELMGATYGAQKVKTSRIFTQKGEVIAASTYTQAEDGTRLFTFGEFTVASGTGKGTYYMQMALTKASATRALYPVADSLTLLMPLKVARMSSGGGGGGGSGSGTKQQPVARLILDGVYTEPENPTAGETFDIVLTLRNTSETLFLRNLQLTYTSDGDALRPVSGTNIEYIDRIDAGATYLQRLRVTARPDIEESTVKVDVSIDFEDKQLNQQSASLSALLNVHQVQRVELDKPTLPTGEVLAGDSYDVTMTVFNMGKTKAYNVTVRAVPEDEENLSPGQSFYIGDMEPGTFKLTELSLIPLKEGDYKADLVVTYETVEGIESQKSESISFTAAADEPYAPEGDFGTGYEEEEAPEPPSVMDVLAVLPWQLYAMAGGLVAGLTLMAGVSARKRRMHALEDDEMD